MSRGSTQADPIAMAMYGIVTFPLLRLDQNTQVSQKWYTDNGRTVERLEDLLLFFKQLTELGSFFGGSVNAPKWRLIVKEASQIKAFRLFDVDGCRSVGSVISSGKPYVIFNVTRSGKHANFFEKNYSKKPKHPLKTLTCASQQAYKKKNFMSRRTLNSRNIFTEAENKIQTQVIPSIFTSPVSQPERRLYSLPTRNGGLNIKEPTDSEKEYTDSLTTCAPPEDEDRTKNHLCQERTTNEPHV